jgi:hypothetical protein
MKIIHTAYTILESGKPKMEVHADSLTSEYMLIVDLLSAVFSHGRRWTGVSGDSFIRTIVPLVNPLSS